MYTLCFLCVQSNWYARWKILTHVGIFNYKRTNAGLYVRVLLIYVGIFTMLFWIKKKYLFALNVIILTCFCSAVILRIRKKSITLIFCLFNISVSLFWCLTLLPGSHDLNKQIHLKQIKKKTNCNLDKWREHFSAEDWQKFRNSYICLWCNQVTLKNKKSVMQMWLIRQKPKHISLEYDELETQTRWLVDKLSKNKIGTVAVF